MPCKVLSDQIRIDRNTMPRMEKTPEGYLRGRAIVTRTGVFRYLNQDGSERLELRHPDDILRDDSLSTLRQIPVTVDHPGELVNVDNAATLSVGLTGETVTVDGQHIVAPITITGKSGIDAVAQGIRELSLGYRVDLKEEAGEYNGQPYTHRQTNVRYNHCAIVAQARAGQMARINLDGAAVLSVETDHKEAKPMTVKVNLDGIEYDAAPEVKKALEKVNADLATANADAARTKADMQKEYDALKGKMDALKEEMDKMKEDRGDAAIAQMVKARVDLLSRAGKLIDVTAHADATDRAIMEAAIKARNDKADMTGKSDDYVAARFDAVIEAVEASGDGIRKQAEKVGARADANADAKPDARADASATILNMWKKEAK
jgi:hypothetical protein